MNTQSNRVQCDLFGERLHRPPSRLRQLRRLLRRRRCPRFQAHK